MKKTDPIGVFDSGIGGLTVVHAIRHLCPHESIVYFGDTAHLPYGEKSADAIRYYSLKITRFLLSKGCKAIIIACNSASSVAYSDLREFFEPGPIVINAVDPLVGSLEDKGYRHIGVIGTQATIDAGSYHRRLTKMDSDLQVTSLATPLLAPMIETGFHTKSISRDIIEASLEDMPLDQIDALLLACTHYPLISDLIQDICSGYGIDVYDSAEPMASQLHLRLEEQDLLQELRTPRHQFYLSQVTPHFRSTAQIFMQDQVYIEAYPLWAGE